ncbi:hypothetical protein LTR36_005558 [Oleoguttula mirabilis]|uniref:RhoGAP-domain-containing protein n=1 Tax=Oleoguttula mirabilis TaxID=1507867 RepID=A0AAV9JEU5_9PEZI|nr:hypothetical protein LTR36_005558 [Oleoguttula mirabilis]
MADEFNSSDLDGNGVINNQGNGTTATATNDSTPSSPAMATATATALPPSTDNASPSTNPPKAVEDVMYSDIGITTLLNRLKQSIASAREFALFLKKRSTLEEEHSKELRRLAKSQLDAIKRSEVRGGSYAHQLAEVLRVHERMAENGLTFALSMHQMHEDLNDLSVNMERGRKQWKHEGLDAEKRASDAEAAMHKAKARYDGLAEDYDRARTGDTKGSRRIGLKGPKSAEQHESDLLRKVQAADADYEEKVRLAKAQRESLISEQRPKAVQELKKLCNECDSALTLQLQKFANFNEKLLLHNGLTVSPLTGENSEQRSLRDVIYDIDNDKDFHSYVGAYASKIPARQSEIRYEQHPTLMPKTQLPASRSLSTGAPVSQPQAPAVQQPTLTVNTGSASQPGSTSSRYTSQLPPGPLVAPSQPQAYNQPAPFQQQVQQPPPPQLPAHNYHSPSFGERPFSPQQAPARETYATPPYPTHPSERTGGSGYPPQQTTGSISAPIPISAPQQQQQRTNQYAPQPQPQPPLATSPPPPTTTTPSTTALPPLRPVFGVSLDDLFARDQSAVPMLVTQCLLAIDHFGLDVEGIYRLSGTASHVQHLRDQANHDPAALDFRNPAAFAHDVNSVATLLKQFFRDLPDPLFTRVGYADFVEAARVEDAGARRDALHQCINDLPDANYATLRALVLHLHRVMMHEGRNRMGSGNLAVCFAPSLMGTHTGAQIADASLQARVLDTILVNATAIFDED